MSNALHTEQTSYRVERTLNSGAFSSRRAQGRKAAHEAALDSFDCGAPVRDVKVVLIDGTKWGDVQAVYTREIHGGKGYAVARRSGRTLGSYCLAGRF